MALSQIKIPEIMLQVSRFGIVGLLATLVHIGLFTLLVKVDVASPMSANIIAFVPAFLLSFYSHFSWTFRCTHLTERAQVVRTLFKFLIAALIGVGLNAYWVYLVTETLKIEYYYSNVFFLFVTPVVLFVFNKFVVFK